MIYDLVSKRYIFFAISLAIILPGLISLILPGGLRPGIDFSSGSLMTVRFDQPVDQTSLRDAFAALGHPEAIVQRSDENTFIIRTLPLVGSSQDQPSTSPAPNPVPNTDLSIAPDQSGGASTPGSSVDAGSVASSSTTAQGAVAQQNSERQRVEDALRQQFGSLTVLSFDEVSPIVAREIVNNSVIAVLAACLGILLYLSWAFRHVKAAWRYGMCA